MPAKVSREPSSCGAVSRAGLVHGVGADRKGPTEMWYDLDTYLLDQVTEVLEKLEEGSLDDEIWGKIVIMEKCKRVAKAYLRKTTIIVDGSEDDFDGKTLGFNAFENSFRDEYTDEIREKISDGVILKMDYQGNIKGMARGSTPVLCQGWKENERRNNCISDRLSRLQGKLNCTEEEKAFKMFDMRRFKAALERECSEQQPDAKTLLLKTTVRVALVKDGGDMNRTPCWFTVVNLVALDMLKSKIPTIRTMVSNRESTYGAPSNISQSNPIYMNPNFPQKDTYGSVSMAQTEYNTQALTQLLAAAVKQANGNGGSQNLSQSLHNLPVSVDQLAHLASSLSIAKTECSSTMQQKKDRRRSYKIVSDDSSGEDSALRSDSTNGGTNQRLRKQRWDHTTKSMDVMNKVEPPSERKSPDGKRRGPARPRLQDVMFDRSYSTTSDYDSNREFFDSGSWSSNGSKCYKGRSTSSSVVSDAENQNKQERQQPPPPVKKAMIPPKPAKDIVPFTETNKTTVNILSDPVKINKEWEAEPRSVIYVAPHAHLPSRSEQSQISPAYYDQPIVNRNHDDSNRNTVNANRLHIEMDKCDVKQRADKETINADFSRCTVDMNRCQIVVSDGDDDTPPRPPSPDYAGTPSEGAACPVEHSAYAIVCRRTAKGSSQEEQLQGRRTTAEHQQPPAATATATTPRKHADAPAAVAVPVAAKTANSSTASPSVRRRLTRAWDSLLRRTTKDKRATTDTCNQQLQSRDGSASTGWSKTHLSSSHSTYARIQPNERFERVQPVERVHRSNTVAFRSVSATNSPQSNRQWKVSSAISSPFSTRSNCQSTMVRNQCSVEGFQSGPHVTRLSVDH